MHVGTGVLDGPSEKFDLDGQIFSHFTEKCFDFGASSPKIKNGPSRTPVPTCIAVTALNDHLSFEIHKGDGCSVALGSYGLAAAWRDFMGASVEMACL